jgi:hypothetical protein
MIRERALKVVLVVVGLLCLSGVLTLVQPMTANVAQEQMLSVIYATLGVFLLLAFRNPSAHRSLIAFTAWSSLTHGTFMLVQVFHGAIARGDMLHGVVPLIAIGIVLLVLTPAKRSGIQTAALGD